MEDNLLGTTGKLTVKSAREIKVISKICNRAIEAAATAAGPWQRSRMSFEL
jgi:hypothetical protein